MQCQLFLNHQNNNKNKPKYILLIVLTKMDKIGVNKKGSSYFGAVTTFDFGVNIGEPQCFGAFSDDTMVEMKKKMLQKLIRQLNLLLMSHFSRGKSIFDKFFKPDVGTV